MVTRSPVHYPDALAKRLRQLVFTPVDEELVLEDRTRRLEIYRIIEHSHMPNAVLAYVPKERIIMEGELGNEAWQLHWWGNALAAKFEYYEIDPEINIPVHGTGATLAVAAAMGLALGAIG